MSLFGNMLTKLFGSKYERDLKELNPFVDKIKAVTPSLVNLNNDELREEANKLKAEIRNHIQKENDKIAELKSKTESIDTDINERDKIYKEIDKIEKQIDDLLEDKLLECLPRAFAILKETAQRFTDNKIIEVTASDFDRELAAQKRDFVEVENNKALWKNEWVAGGNTVTWEMVHYDVQLFGGVALHQGKIAEMATGEGKTLVATLPVFLNALTGRGVHVVTVNDYLAKRDSEWMGPLYMFHGLSVDCIDKHSPSTNERRNAYNCDITFGTNNEFGFDYLRDNMASFPEDLVQRKHNYAIVDEVDSVLIDDARTPLIISGPIPKGEDQLFDDLKPRVESLYEMQRKMVSGILADAKRKIKSTDKKEAEEGALLLLRVFKGLPKNKPLIKFLSEPGIKSQMLKTENFYMQENNKHMHVVTDPLYFVIDEKNNSIELTDKGIDLLTGNSNDPDFFVLPDIGSEIAELEKLGISEEEMLAKKDEMLQNYAVKSERVHTVNQLLKAYALFEKNTEYVVMDNKVKIVDEKTGRIMEGRRYSDGLHQAIEAKERVKVEAATQTYATITLQNYFRMYHKLAGMTGTAQTEAGELWDIYKLDVVVIPTNKPIARDDRQDKIYKTNREKYNAVIEEIDSLVKAGRPVLVGTTSVEISELLSRMLNLRHIKHNVLNAKLHQKEADIVAEAGNKGVVTIATNMAGRGTDIKLTDEVKAAGGLAIIGTERHESRRVDRQLRGRSGRQGDIGSSQFFVSLEDNLMRLFGSERISKIMDRMGHKDGDVLQHSALSSSIERAQKKVEENHFGVRKHLLDFDDVMNSQREVIYTKRRHALFGERIQIDLSNMIFDTCHAIISEYHDFADYKGFSLELIRVFSSESPFDETEFIKGDIDDLTDKLYDNIWDNYQRKVKTIAEQAYPVIKNVYEMHGEKYTNIVVPFTDGQKMMQIPTNLKLAYDTQGKDLVKSFEKSIILMSIDNSWKEHLRELDDLRTSVQNASYEQKDPLLIYKLESFNLFKKMLNEVNRNVVSTLVKASIPTNDPNEINEQKARRRQDNSRLTASKRDFHSENEEKKDKPKPQPVRVEKKVGRNEPCPCGSGKKYKQCHGKA